MILPPRPASPLGSAASLATQIYYFSGAIGPLYGGLLGTHWNSAHSAISKPGGKDSKECGETRGFPSIMINFSWTTMSKGESANSAIEPL